MFNPSRADARTFFFETWRKHKAGAPLSPLEGMLVDILLAHPEYHCVLDEPERSIEQEYFPEQGETNPFLHLAMHLAIMEQDSIDQPPGIRRAYANLAATRQDAHQAQHVIMECLAETIWQAQRHGTDFDGASYLKCIERAGTRPLSRG
ncbi:MAG: DUF1841 family protein [Betaproteobacteria bacterium]|nr:DUF1841 family protein [Betaproteobacteria bacterium]